MAEELIMIEPDDEIKKNEKTVSIVLPDGEAA